MDVELGKVTSLTSKADAAEDFTVDWRGRPSDPDSHGGARAAAFVLGLQAFEITAIAAVGNNLITYVINEMHLPLAKSANVVTNFVGTIFLLSLFGGFLSDSYLGSFWTMLVFGFIELSGFILLSVQAHLPQLKPPKCDALLSGGACEEAKGIEAVIFYVALYLVALGSGCVKPNMIAHGADQFAGRPGGGQLSTYFNAAYFAFSVGELVALTLLVWAQTHFGMDVGFGISAAAMAVGLICLVSGAVVYRNKRPRGSIFTPIAQVIVAAISKRKQVSPSDAKMLHGSQIVHSSTNNSYSLIHSDRFRWLDKACIKPTTSGGRSSDEGPWRLCTVNQVEQVKTLISLLPIFASTIIFNTILAQLQTFSVQQASVMNTRLSSSFSLPPASLQSIPYLLLLLLVPAYDKLLVPLLRRLTSHPSGISPLQRIGSGLLVSSLSMAVAASMESKRRHSETLISVFWIAPQYVVFGVSEMLTAVGLIEFFYKQSMTGMQAFLTAMTYCSYSFGFYLSSVLVALINKMTTDDDGKGWLSENDLNQDRLDLFYWMLGGLSLVNFFNYVFWAKWFSYNPALMVRTQRVSAGEEELKDRDHDMSYSGNHVIA